MENTVIDIKKRFDLKGTKSLCSQVRAYFGEEPVRIMTQIGLFPGYDEVAVLLKGGPVYRCLVSDGVQVSDWIEVIKENQR